MTQFLVRYPDGKVLRDRKCTITNNSYSLVTRDHAGSVQTQGCKFESPVYLETGLSMRPFLYIFGFLTTIQISPGKFFNSAKISEPQGTDAGGEIWSVSHTAVATNTDLHFSISERDKSHCLNS